jgi:hypothetical protein
MDPRTLIATCDEWPPRSVLDRTAAVTAHASSLHGEITAPATASRLASEIAGALPPCTERSRFTEICFGRHSGLATAVAARVYPAIGHVLVALSHLHGCPDLYFHAADLRGALGPDRFEIVQFEASAALA